MGLITAVAVILASQGFPDVSETHWVKDVNGISIEVPAPSTHSEQPTQDRLNEIWDHVDNRVIRQLDLWFDDGEFPKSISLLKVEYAYSPDDYDVVTNLGWMQENTEQMEEAKNTYTDYSQNHPGNGNAMFPLGLYYYMRKDFEKTVQTLEPSLKYNPGPNTYRILGKCYERMKKDNDAIRIWELELKRFPNEGPAIANIKRVKAKMAGGKGK